jgi:hypothetical protein
MGAGDSPAQITQPNHASGAASVRDPGFSIVTPVRWGRVQRSARRRLNLIHRQVLPPP